MNDETILSNSKNVLVVGMNADPKKYANKIYKQLKNHDKNVFGVNPNYTEIDGDTIYADVTSVDHDADLAVMVVAPRHGIHMLEAIKDKGITNLWLQPGTFDQNLLDKALELGLNPIQNCVLQVYYNQKNAK